jgi:hypothetical protein
MGDLDESAIPNEDFEPHYLNDGDTKSDSSFPVVDGDGNLRAGNVNSAWDLRNQGEGVSEECLRNLDNAFDENILPDTAYENSSAPDEWATASRPSWRSGMMVEWRGIDATGRIVHVPDDQHILMVDVMERTDEGWTSTGYTLTAGYQDVVPMANEQENPGGAERYAKNDTVDLTEFSDGTFGMNLEFTAVPDSALTEGFNQYGVRENEDGSLDVRFKAMEPGERQGVEITADFLRRTASHEYGRIPLQLDHSKSQLANAGYIEAGDIQFRDGYLGVQAHIPNTGSDKRDDIIADFTHEPPMIQDISVGFDPDSVEANKPAKRGGVPQFRDARIQEFSLTPFPAGYDNGGLTPAFSEALDEMTGDDCGCGGGRTGDSQLDASTRTLRKK